MAKTKQKPSNRCTAILAENLSKYRKMHGYTALQLSEVIDTTPAMVSRYENGISWPAPATLEKLADLYQIAIADLFAVEGTAEKAFSLAATRQSAIDVVNRLLGQGDLVLRERKK